MEEIAALVTKTLSSFQNSERTSKPYDPIEVMNNAQGSLTGYDCPKCKNKGVIYYLQDGYEVFKDCECMAVRKSIRRIEKSGLKDALEEKTFERFNVEDSFHEEIKSKSINYIKSKDYQNNWFFMGGQSGCGKTHLCTAITRKLLIGLGKNTRYLQWKDETPKIKARANKEEYEELVEPYKIVEVLYIDDLFKVKKGQPVTTADVNIAFEILNYRYRNSGLITIISSEWTIQEIVGIDEAIGSRIFEKSGIYCLNIQKDIKKNYRLKNMF